MAKTKTPYPFEDAFERLEALVSRMESGDLTLEESMQTFEEGVKLTRECQQALPKFAETPKHFQECHDASRCPPNVPPKSSQPPEQV